MVVLQSEHCASVLSRTCACCRVLQQRFEGMEEASPGSARLSLNTLAAGLSRLEAARLFYQICSALFPLPDSFCKESDAGAPLQYRQATCLSCQIHSATLCQPLLQSQCQASIAMHKVLL